MQCEKTKDIKVLQVSCSDADRYLPPERNSIEAMKKSLQEIGQINSIGVHPVTHNTYRVIVGATRFRAASELGWETIRASIWSGSAIEFQIHELTENVERRELSGEQRKQMRYKIKELQRERLAAIAPSKGGRGKKGGLRNAAREADVPRTTAQRRQHENDKVAHNEGSGPVSDGASPVPPPTPSSNYGTRKHSIGFPIGLYRRLTAWCEQQNITFAEGVRRICRERMDNEESKASNVIPMQAKA